MFFRTSQLHNALQEARVEVCHRVHAAGLLPNGMHRFLQSNAQEVLFVI
jgi:hypothetical protein